MNEANVGAALGTAVSKGLIPTSMNVQVSNANNGWVITRYGQVWVAKTWNEMTDKLKELFQIVD